MPKARAVIFIIELNEIWLHLSALRRNAAVSLFRPCWVAFLLSSSTLNSSKNHFHAVKLFIIALLTR